MKMNGWKMNGLSVINFEGSPFIGSRLNFATQHYGASIGVMSIIRFVRLASSAMISTKRKL